MKRILIFNIFDNCMKICWQTIYVFVILKMLILAIICHWAKEGCYMSTIRVGENESLDSALRRFKRKCSRDGIIGDLRRKEFYERPSVRRKKKAEAAKKRNIKG